MKKVLFLIFIVITTIKLQAQNSDLYSHIMTTIKPTYFPAANVYQNTTTGYIRRDNQPVLVLNDVVRSKEDGFSTKFEDLNGYTMANLQRIVVWNTPRDNLRIYAYPKGALGVLFVYTKDYVFPNPAQPTTPRTGMGADSNPNKIVVFQAP